MKIRQKIRRYVLGGAFEIHFDIFCAWMQLLGWVALTGLVLWGLWTLAAYAFLEVIRR